MTKLKCMLACVSDWLYIITHSGFLIIITTGILHHLPMDFQQVSINSDVITYSFLPQ